MGLIRERNLEACWKMFIDCTDLHWIDLEGLC